LLTSILQSERGLSESSRSITNAVVADRRLHYDAFMPEAIAGFDIGGTKIALSIATPNGRALHRTVQPTNRHASDSIEEQADYRVYHGLALQLISMLCEALEETQISAIQAIGVVSAGPIRGGLLISPPNIVPAALESAPRRPLHIPIVSPLLERFSCPVSLLNDCNGAVLGEVYYGFGRNTDDKSLLHLAYATISTGFGAGAWDGGLILGKDGNAGELGHIPVRIGGLRCGCGNLGCVEAYASGTGLVSNAKARLLALDTSMRERSALVGLLADGEEEKEPLDVRLLTSRLTPSLLFDAADRGDPLAREVIAEAIFAAGVAFSVIANAYDPTVILVGGGIALGHPELLDGIRSEMLEHLNVAAPRVEMTSLGASVTERGAVALAQSLLPGGN
jgi:glucokinase